MWFRVCILFIVAICSIVGMGHTVSAEMMPERRLLITPLRNELIIDAGTSYKGAVTLRNTGTSSLTIKLDAQAFDVINQNYDYAFKPKSPVNNWVSFAQPSIVLNAGQSYIVSYLISVPIGAEPGGKYISIFASAQPATTDGVTSVDRVGSLIYITIPGAITKTGELLSLRSGFVTTDLINWSAVIRNSGSAHFRTTYEARLSTLWNADVTTTQNIALILPSSVRLVQGTIEHPTLLGLYKVHYTFSLGDTPSVEKTLLVLYLPPIQVIPVVGFFTLAGVITFKLIQRSNKLKNTN